MKEAVFTPKTDKIAAIYKRNPAAVDQIKTLFKGRTNIYIDYANVRPWSERLGWHVDTKRLMQFLKSFDNASEVSIYEGTLVGDRMSEQHVQDLKDEHYRVVTKPVKIMYQSIDTTSINDSSPELLAKFIRRALLNNLDVKTVQYLNGQLKALNTQGLYAIEDKKCNFDVEIGVDMLLDLERDKADTFILWSGDSDFSDALTRIIDSGRNTVLFATSRVVSKELNTLSAKGLFIFDIQKIRDFLCWNREYKAK